MLDPRTPALPQQRRDIQEVVKRDLKNELYCKLPTKPFLANGGPPWGLTQNSSRMPAQNIACIVAIHFF
jgi:hypothetical protein